MITTHITQFNIPVNREHVEQNINNNNHGSVLLYCSKAQKINARVYIGAEQLQCACVIKAHNRF